MIKYRQAVKVTGDQTATSHLIQLGWKPQKAAANVKMVKVLTLFNVRTLSPPPVNVGGISFYFNTKALICRSFYA
jgi:hypothetical protein